MKKLLTTFLGLFLITLAFSQNEYNIWYFGERAGLDFNTTPPTALTDGEVYTTEGCASYSDNEGNLLFYTNGVLVYTKAHEMMENGDGLFGHSTSTQSVVIVPKPSADSIYYLFTVNGIASIAPANRHGFNYSIVDMRENDGLGAVVEKNVNIRDTCTEHLVVIPHSNGTDYWLIVHGLGDNNFYAYLFNGEGVFGPVQTTIGHTVYVETGTGQSQASPDGNRLAIASSETDWYKFVEVYDFNRSTGDLSNAIYIPSGLDKVYGLEFSPDNTKLYRTDGNNRLYQYILYDDYASSGTLLTQGTQDLFGHLQLGPDNKIYISRYSIDRIGVIENPNGVGAACNLNLEGIFLEYKECMLGLPTNIQRPIGFRYDFNCEAGNVAFFSNQNNTTETIWNFGDGMTSDLSDPVHEFDSLGFYTTTLTVISNEDTTIYEQSIFIPDPIGSFLPEADLSACNLDSVLLEAPEGFIDYVWQDSSKNASIVVRETGMYAVTVTNNQACRYVDSVFVYFEAIPPVDLTNDQILCPAETLTLTAGEAFTSYAWSNGANSESISIDSGGWYAVTVTNSEDCESRDSIFVEMSDIPLVSLPADTSICEGDHLELLVEEIYVNYEWQDSSIEPDIIATEAGLYTIIVSDEYACLSTDSILISNHPPIQLFLGNDTTITTDASLILDAGPGFTHYEWSDGSTESTFKIEGLPVGNFVFGLTVTDEHSCLATDSILITIDFLESITYQSSAIFQLYPNPVKEELYIRGDDLDKLEEVVIYTIQGIKLGTYQVSTLNPRIVLPAYDGLLFVLLRTAEGNYGYKVEVRE